MINWIIYDFNHECTSQNDLSNFIVFLIVQKKTFSSSPLMANTKYNNKLLIFAVEER